MENPSSLVDGHAMHTGHNGRPPDLVLQVSSSPVLERPGSPLEDGRGTKKQRNLADPISVDVEDESMETDEAANNRVTGAAEARPSYARMAAKLPQQYSFRRNLNSENEIEVLDEDCSVDESGPFPIIRFSDKICFSCGVYGHSMEGCRGLEERTGEVHTSGEPAVGDDRTPSFSSKGAELFGPWMVVENRRRRTKPSSATDLSVGLAARSRNSSRFGVLEEYEESMEVDVPTDRDDASHLSQGVAIPGIRSAAYIASNPDKSKKKKKGMAESHERVVLPFIPGQRTVVINREASSSRGVHKAVSIVEDGIKSKRAVGINIAKSKGGVTRVARDKVFASGHSTGSLAGSDWVRGSTEQVDVVNADMFHEGRDIHTTTHERSEDPPDTEGIILVDEDCMDASDGDAADAADGHRTAY
ncbi:hypothetical protein V6N13_094951 [Hibiscus sabdariffa]|uniref:CCHC-type domain-containing protein n=1 Tax=Hibiscus sabdariffa TaxID=183260 RepID=A0ABR2PT61_9ROSI